MELLVNGKASTIAPVTIVVAPFAADHEPAAGLHRHAAVGLTARAATTIRCWPEDATATRIEKDRR